MNLKKLVAIGGGEIKNLDTLSIDKEIVRLTGKKNPKALFIPTASNDAQGYWETFQEVYGNKLGCKTQVLYLIKEHPTQKEIQEKILGSDLIYVGGGNTLKMLQVWRRQGVDKLLKTAYEKGIVISGLSAGAICWFRYGCSDSRRFSDSKDTSFMKVKGLEFVNLTLSPHHIREPHRDKGLESLMRTTPGVAIALDDNCAIEIVGETYRLISSKEKAGAKRIYFARGKIHQESINVTSDYNPLFLLLKKA